MKALATIFAVLLLAAAPRAGLAEPVVVELFTSQGCNSCPPAEALLHELAGEKDLIALEFHVDYWDYLGWRDPFSLTEASQRQRGYGHWFSLGYVYTPQMVIDGEEERVGSRRGQVLAAIEAARTTAKPVDVAIDPETGLTKLEGPALGQDATLWLVAYDEGHETDVLRGENAGRRLLNTNVVRHLEALGRYDGGAREIVLPLAALRAAGRSHLALLVQAGDQGRILGAGRVALAGGH